MYTNEILGSWTTAEMKAIIERREERRAFLSASNDSLHQYDEARVDYATAATFGGGRFLLLRPIRLIEGPQRVAVIDLGQLGDGVQAVLMPRDAQLRAGYGDEINTHALVAGGSSAWHLLATDGRETGWLEVEDGEIIVNLSTPSHVQMHGLQSDLLDEYAESRP